MICLILFCSSVMTINLTSDIISTITATAIWTANIVQKHGGVSMSRLKIVSPVKLIGFYNKNKTKRS